MRNVTTVFSPTEFLSFTSLCAANLVQSETDGLHVLALSPFLPAVLLHEGNHKAAVWTALLVWVLQHDLELRIQPKTCWRQEMKKLKCFLFRL